MRSTCARLAVCLLAVCVLSAGGRAAAAAKYVIKIADSQPETSAVVQHIKLFGDLIAKRTNGEITVQIFPAAMMGPAPTVMQQVQMGAIDVYRCDASVLYDFGVTSMKVLSLPYLFKSKEYAQEILYGEIGAKFLKDVDDADINFKTIGWIIEPSRNLFLRNKKVSTLADMKGLKIRVPESEIFLATMEAFGAAATPIPMGEVYTSLQTGVVDGAENTIDTFNVNRFDEVCKYIALDQHNFNICPMVFSKINWDKLDAAWQRAVIDCWDEASHAYDAFAIKNDVEAQDVAKSRGVEFTVPSDKQAWIDAVRPLYAKFGAGFEDVIAKIQAN
ncbi:MAG: TRAP transporter substrate-binding protein [Planctomycetota bacterium]|jgi:tripartite ATP-independent transporter DctP family solute receptor|nr:TRAP transporter substrate-binding protein [Planctomycetota bacterium]